MKLNSFFSAVIAVMVSIFVIEAQASTADIPFVEGADGQQYILGEIQLTSELQLGETAPPDTDFKVTVASIKDDMAGTGKNCKVYSGVASVYGLNNGPGDSSTQVLAGGGRLDVTKPTAAMKPPVPLHTNVKVTNKRNGKTVVVKVNDRGPYVAGRIIDLSPAAARGLGFSGLTTVEVEVCGRGFASAN